MIVPARNEASILALTVQSLLQQNYAGPTHIFLADDHSTDGTGEIASRTAREAGRSDCLSVVQARSLPAGWTGKLWAVSEALREAESFNADYYWFTDADIVHEPDNLSGLLERAETGGLDMVSLMVKLRCESLAERLLIPAFTFFFFMLYPPAWVAQQHRRSAAAAGGCVLIRRGALQRIGGVAAIRNQLIDDCALARAVKSGGSIWLGLASKATSVRGYGSWREIGGMISRTAFTQLHHSFLLLCAVIAGMAVTYLAPLIVIGFGSWAAGFGMAAWLLMSIAYSPMLRVYGLNPLWAPLLPLTAVFYLCATVYSAVQYWMGQGGSWKGRVQDPS